MACFSLRVHCLALHGSIILRCKFHGSILRKSFSLLSTRSQPFRHECGVDAKVPCADLQSTVVFFPGDSVRYSSRRAVKRASAERHANKSYWRLHKTTARNSTVRHSASFQLVSLPHDRLKGAGLPVHRCRRNAMARPPACSRVQRNKRCVYS